MKHGRKQSRKLRTLDLVQYSRWKIYSFLLAKTPRFMRSDDPFHTYFHNFLPSHREVCCFIAVRIYWNLSVILLTNFTYLTDSPYRKSMKLFYSFLRFCFNNILIQMTTTLSDRNLSQFYGKYYCFCKKNSCV